MIIRVQTSHGMKRLQVESKSSLRCLHDQVHKLGILDTTFQLYKSKSKQQLIPCSTKTVDTLGFKNGDIIYAHVEGGLKSTSNSTTQISNQRQNAKTKPIEDDIDLELWKEDGRIKKNDNQSGMFKMNNLSLEPWNENYLKENGIKFMSFHAYMRKQTSGVDKGKYFKLEDFKAACSLEDNTKVNVHDLPSAVTLNRQKFRLVDNIEFENGEIVNRFLDSWRNTNSQRMAFLYGKYSKHPDIPLGIKAEVAAIYEPKQLNKPDSLKILDDQQGLEIADKIAKNIGLMKIGWIFTDLIPLKDGKVKNTRNSKTHYLSAEECISAGHLQNLHPSPCRLSSDGHYGSKFVTVVVSGDKENQISFEGYQVSTQCMSLVNDNCLIPTIDAPELGYIKESSEKLYVADVYYREKDEYGNEAQKIARPLPLEYLITEMQAAFSVESKYSASCKEHTFPPPNRHYVSQSLGTLASYMKNFTENNLIECFSDFNVLYFLANNPNIPLIDDMDLLFEAVREKNNDACVRWSNECENWLSLKMMMELAGDSQQMDATNNVDDDMMQAIQRSINDQ